MIRRYAIFFANLQFHIFFVRGLIQYVIVMMQMGFTKNIRFGFGTAQNKNESCDENATECNKNNVKIINGIEYVKLGGPKSLSHG